MEIIDDQEILNLCSKPETKNQGFSLIVKKYSQKLYYHIRRILIDHEDSNDALQDTLLKAFSYLDNFRSESGLYTWLYRIATNNAITFLNKKKRTYTFSSLSYEDVLADKLESDVYFDGDDLQKKLQKSILKLPTKQRIVFNMKYYDEMKYEEIAEVTGTSVGALKASYHHAVIKIEKYINED
jgi:RNA polymerase sigma-70 factor (ECF subfamily)